MSDLTPGEHEKVRIRSTHPALYRQLMILSVMSVLLAVNFWRYTPTFVPFNIPKDRVGAVFFVLGVSQFLFLNVFHQLRLVRATLAVSLSFMLFWGASNTQQAFAGNASFQLPILLITLAVLHIPLLVESPVNPMTEREI